MKCKIIALALVCASLCACQNLKAEKDVNPGSYSLAANTGSGPKHVEYVPVPMPGQFMSKKAKKSERLTGEAAINAANKKAVKQPNSGEYINSIMTFDYMQGALYQIYCAPLSVTDIQFQNNEHIIAVGAGDTTRWVVTKVFSGIGASKQEHLFVKPHDEELTNSLVITTDMRTYHLMLHSTSKTYMASVAWRYSDSEGSMLTALDDNLSDSGDVANTIDVSRLRFNYLVKKIKGPQPDWFPKMVFNDGNKTYIKFPAQMQEAPNLFIGTGDKTNQVVNYRVQGDYYVIDNVIYWAQLCSGPDNSTTVQISPKK
ncbi:type IV secretion system protein TrbG [Gammaproteobacteria bacterium]